MAEKTLKAVDNAKKARLFLLSIIITLSLFVIRSWGLVDVTSNREIFLLAFGYFVFTYFGLALALKFQLNRKSLLFVLPQSSLFVASEVLFIMLFFFRDFERLFDVFFLLLLVIIFLLATYAIFLMANVLNVATFKPLPLLQVATTSSYLATVLMVYFITFAISTLTVDILWILGSLFVAYMFILIFQYYQINDYIKDALKNVFLSSFSAVVALSMVLIMGPHHELSALVPAAVVFGFIGLEMAEQKAQIQKRVLFQYIIVVIAAFLINIIFNTP